jgi:hypothetical protein
MVRAEGDRVPAAEVRASGTVRIGRVKRGIDGRVGHGAVRIVRPRYGWRRRDRPVLVDGPGVEWRTVYRTMTRYEIQRRADGSVVYRYQRSKELLDPAASAAEVSLALAVAYSGVIDSSSLLNYVSI